MKTLLWKDIRENWMRFVLIPLGFAVLLWLSVKEHFEGELADFMFDGTCIAGGVLLAAVLAMDMVTTERSKLTMECTLSRPVPPYQFYLSKFLVGSLILFICVLAFIATLYRIVPGLVKVPDHHFDALAGPQILENVPSTKLLILCFPAF